MKKQLLFLSLAVAALLVGCSKESDAPNGGVSARHISAKSTGSESPETKAPLTGTSLNGQQAQIYTTTLPLEAYTGDKTKMFTDAYAAGTMTFADNRYSQYDAGFNGAALLPADKSELYMYGFYPLGWTSASAGTYESLSHTFDGKTDLMSTWLSTADQQKIAYQGGTSGTLPDKADLMFRHLLTCYNIRVVGVDAAQAATWGRIKSINLKNREIDKVSTGENLGYAYSADGGAVSFYKLAGTPAAPTYSDDLFEQAAFANMFTPTTTVQTACYSMAAPVTVDAASATAELTLVVKALDMDGGTETTVEIPVSLDQTKFAANGNSTRGYTVSITLSFAANAITPTASIDEWAAGATYEQDITPPAPPTIGDLKGGGIIYEINGSKVKVLSLDQGTGLEWSAQDTYVIGADGQSDTDGKANVAAIKTYFANNTATVGTDFSLAFPAANFCDKKNTGGVTGWYLPAMEELKALFTAYKTNKTAIDAGIANNGGTAIHASGNFWSSTEVDYATTWAWFVDPSGFTGIKSKISTTNVRCFKEL